MIKCQGCGAYLQTENETKEGYTQNINNPICERCFQITHYNKYQNSNKTNEVYLKIINEITGFSVANSLPDGNVLPTIVHGSNFKIDKKYIDSLKDIIINSKVVILQMEIPLNIVEYIIEICSINNKKIILNTAPANNISIDYLKKCDFIIANESESEFYTNIYICYNLFMEIQIWKIYIL